MENVDFLGGHYETFTTIWNNPCGVIYRRIAELCDSAIDPCKYIWACTDVCMPVYEMDQTGRCERNGCIFNRDYAAYVYTGGSRADHFMGDYPTEAAGLCSDYNCIYSFGNAGIRTCNRLDAERREERRR